MEQTLGLIVQPRLSARESLAADGALLAEAADPSQGRTGTLRVYGLEGDVLSLGRYHLAPEPCPSAVHVTRRRSGGRAMPWGEGFVGFSLVLRHPSALSREGLLGPDQVLNRYVRGILAACESFGVPAFYPGRDLVTVEGRMLAMVSFDVAASGAVVVEAVLAIERDFTELPRLLDRADPRGVVRGAMVAPRETIGLAALIGRTPELNELADRVRQGYEQRLGVRFEGRMPPAATDFDEEGWLGQRRGRPGFERRVEVAGQLGILEVYAAIAAGRIRDVMFAGDVIANAATIDRLEHELSGCPAERVAIEEVVTGVLATPGNFLLGLGTPASAAAAIAGGLVP